MNVHIFLILAWCLLVDASMERDAFVSQMDAAMKGGQRDSRVASRLMAKATPLEDVDIPRFLQQEQQEFAINMTEYALRYIGCQNVHQYSDELAQDEDSMTVLGMNRFVIVRLCPKDHCSNYHHYGCNAGFGDYLIPMEDYLQTMAEEYFSEYQTYCETCYGCDHAQSNYAANDDGNANDNDNANANANANAAGDDVNENAAAGDDANNNLGDDANANNGNNGGRKLENDDGFYYMGADFYNQGNNNANQNTCANYTTACTNYRSACKDYSQFATDMESFFECSEFQIGDYSGYLGPHCRSDGTTIGIGLYKDAYCNEYNSDFIDVSTMIGMDLSDEHLKSYYSSTCISCDASESFTLVQNEGEEITAVCGSLYDISAKCNRYMGNDGNYNSENQAETEDEVCTFIHNLITNTYDEYGHIYLDYDWKAYIPDVRTMSQFQKYAMSFSVILVAGLFSYAIVLYREISTSKFAWYPSRRRMGGKSTQMQRVHSGIIQGRSRSELHEGAMFA